MNDIKTVSEEKLRVVKELSEQIKHARTILIASCRGLPSAQFHDLKKKLRGTAAIVFLKKRAIIRAMDMTEKGALQELKKYLTDSIALLISDKDAFELSGMLTDNQIPTKAKAGDIAPEDIEIQPGPTDLVPGPAISELSGVGLKVAVKEGKLEIIKGAIVAKQGEAIKPNVASVLGKLGVSPMKVGFIPVAAYDAKDEKVYGSIRIDKEGTLDALREAITKSLAFAVSRGYVTKETIGRLISKAALQEKALVRFINQQPEGG